MKGPRGANTFVIKLFGCLLAIVVLLRPDAVFAQAGTTGGSVGKQDKSISGDSAGPSSGKSAPSTRNAPSKKNASSSQNKKSQDRRESGSQTSFNGTWNGLSIGGCFTHYSWTIQVSNGIISGNNATGRVSSGGSVNGYMMVMGNKYNFAGHARSGQASGSWIKTGDCSGRWTATKS
jgi:hypothetical protein